MAEEQRPRRKSTAARPDYRKFLAGEEQQDAPPATIAPPPSQDEEHAQIDIISENTVLPHKATRAAQPEGGNVRQRFRTTIFLSPELEDVVDQMKIAAKRQGRRETLQDYIEQGLRLLAAQRGIRMDNGE
jgi:hypothetical protein